MQRHLSPNEREKYVFNLLQPYVRLSVCGTSIYIKPPTLSVLEDACDIYEDIINNNRFEDVVRSEVELELLQTHAGWSDSDEGEFKSIPKRLDFAKKILYESRVLNRNLSRYRVSLNNLRKQYASLSKRRQQLYSVVFENIAQKYKLAYQIYSCAMYENKEVVFNTPFLESSGHLLQMLVNKYQYSILSEEIVRDLVIHGPWTTLWGSRKETILFKDTPSYSMTSNQQSMIAWSTFYDNVYQSSDRPETDIIEDNDLVDGWMLAIKDKYNNTDEKVTKGRGGSEQVFTVLKNQEDVENFNIRRGSYG